MPDPIRVNGSMLSWGSIVAKVADKRFTGFTSIGYSDSRERVKAYGMGKSQAPRGRSRGKYNVDPVTLTGFKSTIQELREALAELSPTGSYGDVEFEIVVQYVEADEKPITVELQGLTWAKNTTSEEEGPDPLKEDIELDCMGILRNGLALYEEEKR